MNETGRKLLFRDKKQRVSQNCIFCKNLRIFISFVSIFQYNIFCLQLLMADIESEEKSTISTYCSYVQASSLVLGFSNLL